MTGKNLFHKEDARNPPDWNWHLTRGYTKDECRPVFAAIAASPDFWLGLHEEPGCSTLRMCVLDLMRYHDLYFVTNRMGADAKWQTEQWLILHLGIERPTVLISGMKGLVAKALNLDCYIDDNADNANDVVEQTLPPLMPSQAIVEDVVFVDNRKPSCRTYLLNRSYNVNVPVSAHITRVATVGTFLDAELVNL